MRDRAWSTRAAAIFRSGLCARASRTSEVSRGLPIRATQSVSTPARASRVAAQESATGTPASPMRDAGAFARHPANRSGITERSKRRTSMESAKCAVPMGERNPEHEIR